MSVDEHMMDKACQEHPDEAWPERKKKRALRTLLNQRWLISSLARRDIRSRYKQSVLGVAWALLTPVAMTIVYSIVFTYVVKVDTGKIPYPIFSYIALLPWTFFANSLRQGSECLVSNFNLITKIYFPREVFPISAVLGLLLDLGLGVLVLIPLFIGYGVQVTWFALMVIPTLIVQICLMLGVVFLLSSANLFYRDIRHMVPLMTTIWMYMSPIIYPVNKVPGWLLPYYMLNPMAVIIDTYRRTVILGEPPMWGYLGIAAAFSIIILVVGYRVFKKLEPAFAETV